MSMHLDGLLLRMSEPARRVLLRARERALLGA